MVTFGKKYEQYNHIHFGSIAKKELASTNPNPEDELRRYSLLGFMS